MSKAVMLSIQPKWCEKIASGTKTVEIRKTRPKIETPFKCYIYCTKSNKCFYRTNVCRTKNGTNIHTGSNRYKKDLLRGGMTVLNGKVIGEFVCEKTTEFYPTTDLMQLNPIHFQMCEKSCVDMRELYAYANSKKLYGWHISDLVIYDRPKELSEFYRISDKFSYEYCEYACPKGNEPIDPKIGLPCPECKNGQKIYLTKPPQSWCYVEDGGAE